MSTKKTNSIVLLCAVAVILAGSIAYLYGRNDGSKQTVMPTTQLSNAADLEACLANAKAYYDQDVADWNRRYDGEPVKPGTVDPFARAKEKYDGDRYQCYSYHKAEIPAELKHLGEQQ